ncbi:MAG: phosphatase PAP2 family protein [Muribaculaceae bacterium]|nr:phosphatase PAP2 family protein [Muribaculaceae bacterium]
MTKYILSILLIITTFPISAEEFTTLSTISQGESVYSLTKEQKGVSISTDVFALLLPATALTLTLCEKDWKGLIQGVETAAVTAGVTLLLKYTVKEWRPDHSNQHSFPSGHSAVSFASATYLQRRYGWKWGVPAYVIATYVGWGRCFAKKHYWYDVLAGAAIGAGSALIFTKPFAKQHELQIMPVSAGNNIGIYASITI